MNAETKKATSGGAALYLKHVAAKCVILASECSDEAIARKLESLSMELTDRAERIENVFVIDDEE